MKLPAVISFILIDFRIQQHLSNGFVRNSKEIILSNGKEQPAWHRNSRFKVHTDIWWQKTSSWKAPLIPKIPLIIQRYSQEDNQRIFFTALEFSVGKQIQHSCGNQENLNLPENLEVSRFKWNSQAPKPGLAEICVHLYPRNDLAEESWEMFYLIWVAAWMMVLFRRSRISRIRSAS